MHAPIPVLRERNWAVEHIPTSPSCLPEQAVASGRAPSIRPGCVYMCTMPLMHRTSCVVDKIELWSSSLCRTFSCFVSVLCHDAAFRWNGKQWLACGVFIYHLSVSAEKRIYQRPLLTGLFCCRSADSHLYVGMETGRGEVTFYLVPDPSDQQPHRIAQVFGIHITCH